MLYLQATMAPSIQLSGRFSAHALRRSLDGLLVSVHDTLSALQYSSPAVSWNDARHRHPASAEHAREAEVEGEDGKVVRAMCLSAEGLVRLCTEWLTRTKKKPVAEFREEAAPEVVRALGGSEEMVARLGKEPGAGEGSGPIEVGYITLPDEFSKYRPRRTEDKQWVSVVDLLKAIGYADGWTTWRDIKDKEEVPELARDFLFKGQGQKLTPCLNAKGVVKLLTSWLPCSPITKRFRDKAAEVVVRYLGGDQSLIDEVKVIRQAIDDGTAPAIAHFCAESENVQRSSERLIGSFDHPSMSGKYVTDYLPGTTVIYLFGIAGTPFSKLGITDDYPRR